MSGAEGRSTWRFRAPAADALHRALLAHMRRSADPRRALLPRDSTAFASEDPALQRAVCDADGTVDLEQLGRAWRVLEERGAVRSVAAAGQLWAVPVVLSRDDVRAIYEGAAAGPGLRQLEASLAMCSTVTPGSLPARSYTDARRR